MMHNVAVISSKNFYRNFDWLKTDYFKDTGENIKEVNVSRRIIKTNIRTYYIISSMEEARGISFNSYIVSPLYEDLISNIRAQINNAN